MYDWWDQFFNQPQNYNFQNSRREDSLFGGQLGGMNFRVVRSPEELVDLLRSANRGFREEPPPPTSPLQKESLVEESVRRSGSAFPRERVLIPVADLKIGEGGWLPAGALRVGRDGRGWVRSDIVPVPNPPINSGPMFYVRMDEGGLLIDIRFLTGVGGTPTILMEAGVGPFEDEPRRYGFAAAFDPFAGLDQPISYSVPVLRVYY